MKIKDTLNKIFNLTINSIKGWNFYSPLIFLTTYLLAYTTFTLTVIGVSYVKFFCFWFVMDISVGICRAATEKIVVYKKNIEETFLTKTYLLSMICVLVLTLLVKVIFI